MVRLILFAVACLLCSDVVAEDRTVIELGGPRKATASVLEKDGTYEVSVSFIPIGAFDSAKNKELSLQKARQYSTQALLRYLGASKATVRRYQVQSIDTMDGRFSTVATIPKDGLEWTKKIVKAKGKPKGTSQHDDSIIDANQDFDSLCTLLVLENQSTLLSVPSGIEEMYSWVGDVEQTAIEKLTSLKLLIEKNEFLSEIERNELLHRLGAEECRYLEQLSEIVKRAEESQSNHAD